jgi:hypothetical protein
VMCNGVKIRVDIFRPEKEGNYPALIAWSNYGKHINVKYAYFPPSESKLLGGKCLTYIGTEGCVNREQGRTCSLHRRQVRFSSSCTSYSCYLTRVRPIALARVVDASRLAREHVNEGRAVLTR